MNEFRREISLTEFFLLWLSTFGIYALSLLLNIIITAVIGAFAGWLLSLTFLGKWITAGFNVIGIAGIKSEDLYKIGSMAGFIIGLTKGQFSIKK